MSHRTYLLINQKIILFDNFFFISLLHIHNVYYKILFLKKMKELLDSPYINDKLYLLNLSASN